MSYHKNLRQISIATIENPQILLYNLAMAEANLTERKQKILAKIAQFRLFDDDFMSKVFEDDIEATEFLLKIILQRDDLKVIESKGQVTIKNLLGRSVRLDIKAKDTAGKMYNIEVQNPDEMKLGLLAEKTRYFKRNEKGVKRMCKIMEDFAEEERNEEREEIAISLLEDGTLPISKIAEVSKLSENKVKELAKKVNTK